MANSRFIKKLEDEIVNLNLEFGFSNTTNRMGTRGDILEEAVSTLFAKYFPNRCGFGKGLIEDSFGAQSKEVDIIIFDKDSIPPICHGQKKKNEIKVEGFFPIESLWYACEVKKCLNNTELKKTIENMDSVRSLRSRNRIPARMLFAFKSDLADSDIKKEFERYKLNDSEWNTNPRVNVICIIGKGYIFSQFATRIDNSKKVLIWRYVEAQPNFFEVACCIGGMINTITGQSFGSYLFDEQNIKVLEEVEL